jgi:hypothetical protein
VAAMLREAVRAHSRELTAASLCYVHSKLPCQVLLCICKYKALIALYRHMPYVQLAGLTKNRTASPIFKVKKYYYSPCESPVLRSCCAS